jgi:cytochrome c oxidase cbb3-type subunit 2
MRTLVVGLPGSAMPSFGALLPPRALEALVLDVKERCDRFSEERPEPALSFSRPPLYTEESAARGHVVYQREKCGSCHGSVGRGDGPAARTLKDLSGRPVHPRDYTRGVFRGGFRRLDLCRAFSTGLDGTPMPALPGAVSQDDRWDLTHYLVSLSHDRSKVLRAMEVAPSWYEPMRAWGLPWR